MSEKIKICQGIKLVVDSETPRRAGLENLSPSQKDDIWNKDVLYLIEKEYILKDYLPKLFERVKRGEEGKESLNWQEVKRNLENVYISQDFLKRDPFPRGEDFYRKHCPSEGAIWGAWIFLILSIIAETVVLIVQGAMSGGLNPVIFLFAFILAAGGWLLGNFLGAFFYVEKLKSLQEYEISERLTWIEYFHLALGSILILFIAVVRAVFGGEPEEYETIIIITWSTFYIFALTVLLGLLVAVAKGTVIYLNKKRAWALRKQQEALKAYASIMHEKSMKIYETRFNELYKEMYKVSEEVERDKNEKSGGGE